MSDAVDLIYDTAKSNAAVKRQEKLNQQIITEEERRYQRERADAQSDLAAANKYNDPKQQMTRLRQAGLNPNLVYGKGAETTSATIRGASGSGASLQPADVPKSLGNTNSIMSIYDTQLKQAQTDQTRQVTQNLKVDQNLKVLDLAGKSTHNQSALVDYDIKKRTADAAVRKLWADMGISHEVNTAKSYENLFLHSQPDNTNEGSNYAKQQLQKMRNMGLDEKIKEAIANSSRTEAEIKAWMLRMERKGLNGSDPVYAKSFVKFLLGLSEPE